jgi:endonuclease/exonuclease/phosphatase family metal-dependent hydrolase
LARGLHDAGAMRHLCVALCVLLNLTALAESAERVRVLTYNIRQGLGPDDPDLWGWEPRVPGTPGELDALADRIAKEKPDIVMLQEITSACWISMGVDQVERIAQRLGMHHHFGVAHRADKGGWFLTMGNAVLSRYPLSEQQVVQLNEDEGELNVRVVTIAKVAHPGVPGGLWAASTHLASKSQDLRMRQLPVLTGALSRLPGPVVLAGDFNAQPANDVHATLGATMTDAFGTVGEGDGLSFPSWKPEARIDYVYAQSPLVPVAARVLTDAKGSDHLPLVAEFEVRTGPVEATVAQPVSLLGVLGN